MSAATRPVVVVADPLDAGGLALLQHHLDVITVEPDGLSDAVATAQALIVRSRTRVTSELLARAERLRLVARAGIGIDNIDVAAATERGILVVNAPLGNVLSTAEHTLALIFALARRIVTADAAVRTGKWKAGYQGSQLHGKVLGVIGVGKVGRTVARLASSLGLRVLAYDPYLPSAALEELGVEHVEFDDLLRQSDIVTLHVPFSDETRYLLDKAELALMKQGSSLINCARGGLVRETALAVALSSGHLAGAAIDVYEHEPPNDSPLLSAPNVVLTPHVAASTREAQAQVSMEVARSVVDFFSSKPVEYPINPSVLEQVM